MRPNLGDSGPTGETARTELGDEIRERKAKQFRSIGTQLGYTYHGSPIVVPDGTDPPEWTTNTYVPSTSPGALAPHAWLGDDQALYDLCGPDFTIVCLDDAETVGRSLLAVAREMGIPCSLVVEDHEELRAEFREPCVVIRPDLHVAWRGGTTQVDAEIVWRRIVGFDLVPSEGPPPVPSAPYGP